MITPIIIQVICYILMAIVAILGLCIIVAGDMIPGGGGAGMGILVLILGPLVIRIYAELIIVLFRINETLTEIKNQK
jgi:hypothetical protein